MAKKTQKSKSKRDNLQNIENVCVENHVNKNTDNNCKERKIQLSQIKNKIRRSELYQEQKRQLKEEKRKIKMKQNLKRKKTGETPPPKQVPKTIESMRLLDETMVTTNDEEVIADDATDEMANYFNRERPPNVLITTSDRPHERTLGLCKDLSRLIPNSKYYYRKGLEFKKIIKQAENRHFTDILVVNEDRKNPNGLIICHLPDGPTATFKMSSVVLSTELKNRDRDIRHRPEVILNNFNTRLGHSIGRLLASLFHFDPNFVGRRAITFHNQRDYIFFRQHRYIFRNSDKVGLREMGPRFTLKLQSLQNGTFDTKFGEFEWFHRRHAMESNRRKFNL